MLPGTRIAETRGIWHDGEEDDGIPSPHDEVHYTYVVLNDGTVTLNNLTVSDAVVGGTVCSKPTLSPGDSFTCQDETYRVRDCDVMWRILAPPKIVQELMEISAILGWSM